MSQYSLVLVDLLSPHCPAPTSPLTRNPARREMAEV